MSKVKQSDEVIRNILASDLTPNERSVFLSWFANKEDFHSSQRLIAERTNIERRNVVRALRKLVKDQYLIPTGKNDKGVTIYSMNQILITPAKVVSAATPAKVVSASQLGGVSQAQKGGVNGDTNIPKGYPNVGDAISTQSPASSIIENGGSVALAPLTPFLSSEELRIQNSFTPYLPPESIPANVPVVAPPNEVPFEDRDEVDPDKMFLKELDKARVHISIQEDPDMLKKAAEEAQKQRQKEYWDYMDKLNISGFGA